LGRRHDRGHRERGAHRREGDPALDSQRSADDGAFHIAGLDQLLAQPPAAIALARERGLELLLRDLALSDENLAELGRPIASLPLAITLENVGMQKRIDRCGSRQSVVTGRILRTALTFIVHGACLIRVFRESHFPDARHVPAAPDWARYIAIFRMYPTPHGSSARAKRLHCLQLTQFSGEAFSVPKRR